MKFLSSYKLILAFCSSSARDSPNRRETFDDFCRQRATSCLGLVVWRHRSRASGRDCIRPSRRGFRHRCYRPWPAACRVMNDGSGRTGNRWAWRATCDRLRSRDVPTRTQYDRRRHSSLRAARGSSWHMMDDRHVGRSVDHRETGCTESRRSARRARTDRLLACICRRILSTTDHTGLSLKQTNFKKIITCPDLRMVHCLWLY